MSVCLVAADLRFSATLPYRALLKSCSSESSSDRLPEADVCSFWGVLDRGKELCGVVDLGSEPLYPLVARDSVTVLVVVF